MLDNRYECGTKMRTVEDMLESILQLPPLSESFPLDSIVLSTDLLYEV
jgi:hypothetical protein